MPSKAVQVSTRPGLLRAWPFARKVTILKLGFGLGPRKRLSLAEIEREAAAEIQLRVDAGKPPQEEWAALEDRVSLDTDVSHLGQWSATPPPAFDDNATVAPAQQAEAALEPHAAPPARAARPAPPRKPAAPKATASSSKPAARKPVARKPVASKPAARQAAVRKPAARRSSVGGE